MLVALNKSGDRIFSQKATKEEKYYCPICNKEMMLKKGDINIAHFAHKSNECNDKWHYDMSEWHINKQSYFDEIYQEVVVEKNGVKHRADILKDGIVIEFQHSSISAEEFNDRNKFYISAGYKVVWVFDLTKQMEEEQLYWDDYSNKENMMRWKHPLRVLSQTMPPNRKNDIIICITWDDIDEIDYENIYRIDWSTQEIIEDDLGRISETGTPDYKKIIVSKPIYMERNMNVKQFFYSESQFIMERLKREGIKYYIKKSGEKGLTRDAYVCPKNNEFGIEIFKKCRYCPYFYDFAKYGQAKFNCFCCFPTKIDNNKNSNQL